MQSHLTPVPELYVSYDSAQKLKMEAADLPSSWDLTPRQICDLELLMNGGFNPLKGFLGEADYNASSRHAHRRWHALADADHAGCRRPSPTASRPGQDIALRDQEGVILAILTITDKWVPRTRRARPRRSSAPTTSRIRRSTTCTTRGPGLSGRADHRHPAADALRFPRPPRHAQRAARLFPQARLAPRRGLPDPQPAAPRAPGTDLPRRQGGAGQPADPPVVGMTKPGDVDHFTRVRCYEAVLDKYPAATTTMSLLNLAMRMAGPREAVWHGLIRKNHGCTHIIVGRDHAGPGKNSAGRGFLRPYDAQDLFREHQDEIGIEMVDSNTWSTCRNAPNTSRPTRSPTRTTSRSSTSRAPSCAAACRGAGNPRMVLVPRGGERTAPHLAAAQPAGLHRVLHRLSGSGKSTIANALMVKLMEMGGRPVTLLDGDVVRKNLSSELGFSKEHRDLNIRRIGYVASEITKNGGIAICAPIAPYATTRRAVREMIEAYGAFVEVHVATSLEECERRDRKGLYKLAREGKIKEFTGISDPYEVPTNARAAWSRPRGWTWTTAPSRCF
jgi:sulfate adenylyltransferase